MIPKRMGYMIDHVLPKNNMALLVEQLLFLSGIALIIVVVKSIYTLLEHVIANKIIRKQQKDLMEKLQELGFAYYEKVATGKILALFEHSVREVQQTYTFLFPQFIYALAQFLVPSIILLQTQAVFFLAAMVGNLLYVLINQLATKKIHHYLGLETQAAKESQQALYDAVVARNEMKAMGSEAWMVDKVIGKFDGYTHPRMKSIFWRHFRFTTVGLTLTISIILFYIFGLDAIRSGRVLFGEFIAYSFLMGLVSRGFSVFFYIIPAQYHALAYAKELYDFMKLETEVDERQATLKPNLAGSDIHFEKVSFSYREDHLVLDDITLTIKGGEKTAIVGESGSGKSTLLKLIGRFYDVSKGELSIDHCSLKKIDSQHLRDKSAYVFQDTYLFNMSIADNIRFGDLNASDEAVKAVAKKSSADDFITKTEEGYHTIVGERGTRLSGGQKQRLAIARMMLKNPDIILLDEATSALDTVTEHAVKNAIDALSEGKTIITVAHRLSTIRHYDTIIVLADGKVVEKGSYDSLMQEEGYFYGLVMRGDNNES